MFEVDLGRIKFKWMGDWNATTTYKADDVVYHAGSSYVCVATSTGNMPEAGSAYWDIMAVGSDLGSLATSAGDLFYYNGNEFRRLAPGSNGQVLKMGVNGNLSWIDPSLVSPVIQTRAYTDYVRTNVGQGGSYYFGQSATGVSITPKRLDSIIKVDVETFGEPNNHDIRAHIMYSTNNGSSWNYMRYNPGNEWVHIKLNAYETDYNSTPGNASTTLLQSFATLNPVCFRIYLSRNDFTFNGSRSSSYEHGQSTITLTELNTDFNSITYNGGTG